MLYAEMSRAVERTSRGSKGRGATSLETKDGRKEQGAQGAQGACEKLDNGANKTKCSNVWETSTKCKEIWVGTNRAEARGPSRMQTRAESNEKEKGTKRCTCMVLLSKQRQTKTKRLARAAEERDGGSERERCASVDLWEQRQEETRMHEAGGGGGAGTPSTFGILLGESQGRAAAERDSARVRRRRCQSHGPTKQSSRP